MLEQTIKNIRKDFPTLVKSDSGENLVHYLDNSATTLKPQVVLNKVMEYYVDYPANIHRGAYDFSARASQEYEDARTKVARFLGVKNSDCIIFTSGTTASSNLFSFSFADSFLQKDDEVILTPLEHHSNLVNWLYLSKKIGFKLVYIPLNPTTLHLEIDALEKLLTPKTKLITLTHVSNTLGVINPIKDVTAIAAKYNVPVSVDIAQSVAHLPINLEELGVTFAFFSGHKLFAPTGIGVFYGKKEYLNKMHPFFFGGGMISSVTLNDFVLTELPALYEAGTPPIAQAIGLGAAIDYLESIGGFSTISKIEDALYKSAHEILFNNPKIDLLLPHPHTIPIFSFNVKKVHSHDVASFFNDEKIAVRTGRHCTQPLLDFLNTNSTVRASFSFYNNFEDVAILKTGINKVWETFYGN